MRWGFFVALPAAAGQPLNKKNQIISHTFLILKRYLLSHTFVKKITNFLCFNFFLFWWKFHFVLNNNLKSFVDHKLHQTKVFGRGLKAIPLSIDLWIHYLTHVKQKHDGDRDYIRSQFERALNACGLEFRSDKVIFINKVCWYSLIKQF